MKHIPWIISQPLECLRRLADMGPERYLDKENQRGQDHSYYSLAQADLTCFFRIQGHLSKSS